MWSHTTFIRLQHHLFTPFLLRVWVYPCSQDPPNFRRMVKQEKALCISGISTHSENEYILDKNAMIVQYSLIPLLLPSFQSRNL